MPSIPTLLPPPTMDGAVPSGRFVRWLALAAVAAAGLLLEPDVLFVIPLLFVIVVPFEKLFPRHRQKVRRRALGTDLAYGLSLPVLNVVTLVVATIVGLVSLAWLPGLALRPLVSSLPPVANLVIGFVLFDMLNYWVHRWSHEVPFLWRFHRIHHSTEHLDWISGLRVHPIDGALLAPAFVFLLAAGVQAETAGVLTALQVVLGFFLHANVRWRLRPLDRVVVTPEFHHWHHADEPGARNTNYSVFLPVWDTIFGTYRMPRDQRPSRYGVTPPAPDGIVAQLREPLEGLPTPRSILLHPIRTMRRVLAAIPVGLGQLWRSTTRPTRARSTRSPAA